MFVDIAENIKKIKVELKELEQKTGRRIYLVGATKTRSVEEINFAIESGLEIVGENRPQEFRDKFPFVSKSANQHFIGHLQKNKIKYVVGKASLIHSCDSVEIANEIDACAKKCGVIQDLLIEIKISNEEDKHGFLPEEVLSAIETLKSFNNLRFTGLMTVLPREKSKVESACRRMKDLFDQIQPLFKEQFKYLSMGMSEDYTVAIENGANMIRLGRAIFGERKQKEQNLAD